jgi:type I restriction enzyme, S subunit
MKLKSYPKYKDSGIQWIEEIPEEWEAKRMRFNALVNPSTKKVLSDPKELINFLPMEKVSENGDYDKDSVAEYQEVSSGYTYFENNDVLIAKITPCFENGKGALVTELKHGFGFGTTEFHVIRGNKKIDPKYLFYLTKTHLFRVTGEAFMEGAAGQKRVPTEFIKNFKMVTPSKIEQIQITKFLDFKISELSKTIEVDKKLIDLLKEKRTALINHVVTKGLNQKANMKDSGIEWIGEIPENWKINKLKHILLPDNDGMKMGPFGSQLKLEMMTMKGIKIYGQENVIYNDFNLGTRFIDDEKFKELKVYEIFSGDVVISTMGTVGNCRIVPESIEKGIMDSHLIRMRVSSKITNTFFSMILNDASYLFYNLMKTSKGAIMTGLNSEIISNLQLVIPPINEQHEVVEYLDKALSRIDQTIQKIEEKITLMEEYKKSLIHHVVTGKVDVREAAA